MTVATQPSEIESAAREMVARYGANAATYAAEWAARLGRDGLIREQTIAYRVLNTVERLIAGAGGTPRAGNSFVATIDSAKKEEEYHVGM